MTDAAAPAASDVALRRHQVAIQKSRALVYTLAWCLGVVGRQLGFVTFSWFAAGLFLILATGTALLFWVLYANGVRGVAGVPLQPVWMASDVAIITWSVYLSGGSHSVWYPWYLASAAGAAYLVGRTGLLIVLATNLAAYVGLVAVTETTDPITLASVVGKMLIVYGAAFFALIGISRLQERRRVIAQLREAESRRATDLERALGTIGQSATSLSSAAEELTAVSQEMTNNAGETATQANTVSAAAEQVSRSVETVATAVEEMTASIREIALNVHDAAKVATDAVRVAESANITMAKLGESSAQISNVVRVITSIAEQTKLLALNATIEAARAGDAGRGFAVVASEVKELAKATANATEDIGAKIATIQADAAGAVEAIGQIGTIIKQIYDLQSSIASAVEEQTATTTEIARNVADAAQGSTDIARTITGVANAAEATSAGAASTQEAARELARMAEELRQT